MSIAKYIYSLFCCIIVGCTTPTTTLRLIEQSESIAVEQPDSALMLINSVDRASIRGKHDMARYRLVMSEVAYYNRIASDCDSLTRPLFDYYYNSTNHAERARAMYQHGIVMYNGGHNPEAMYALLESEKSLQLYNNPRLLGLVYLSMGSIYGAECLYKNALVVYQQAYDIFNELSLEFHAVYTLYNLSEIYVRLRQYDIAEESLIRVLELSKNSGYSEIYYYAVDELCDLYVHTYRFDKLEHYIDILDGRNLYEGFEIQYNYFKAIIYSYHGDRESAMKYLELADSCPNPNKIETEYLKSIVYHNLGDDEHVVHWLRQNKVKQEELLLSVLEFPMINTHIQLLKQDMDMMSERTKNLRFRYIVVFVLLSLTVVGVSLYVRQKIKLQRQEIERYISMISELQDNYTNSSSKILEEARGVYNSIFDDINTLLETYYEHGNTSRISHKMVEQVKSIIDSIKSDSESLAQLERLVSFNYNNIIATIRDSNIRLSEKELKYVIYMLSGLSNRSICLLLDVDAAALYRIKYKVKNKLIVGCIDSKMIELFSRR